MTLRPPTLYLGFTAYTLSLREVLEELEVLQHRDFPVLRVVSPTETEDFLSCLGSTRRTVGGK